jgi:hypothetical protein
VRTDSQKQIKSEHYQLCAWTREDYKKKNGQSEQVKFVLQFPLYRVQLTLIALVFSCNRIDPFTCKSFILSWRSWAMVLFKLSFSSACNSSREIRCLRVFLTWHIFQWHRPRLRKKLTLSDRDEFMPAWMIILSLSLSLYIYIYIYIYIYTPIKANVCVCVSVCSRCLYVQD